MSPMARLTARLPSTLAIPFFMVIRPPFYSILCYSSVLFGVYSLVNFFIWPFYFKRRPTESPMFEIVNLSFFTIERRSVDPALMWYCSAMFRNSWSSSWHTIRNKEFMIRNLFYIAYFLLKLNYLLLKPIFMNCRIWGKTRKIK
jgi:hypothetical protein